MSRLCPHGHIMEGAYVGVRLDGRKFCRTCKRESNRRGYDREKARERYYRRRRRMAPRVFSEILDAIRRDKKAGAQNQPFALLTEEGELAGVTTSIEVQLELALRRANTAQARVTALERTVEKERRSYQNLVIENQFMHSKILEMEREREREFRADLLLETSPEDWPPLSKSDVVQLLRELGEEREAHARTRRELERVRKER